MSTANLVNRLFPGITLQLSHWIFKNNRFPWLPVGFSVIAFGTGAAVFRINWKNGDRVLRIYRKSIGKPYRGLVEMAEYYKKNYEIVLAWYGAAQDLVLPMDFLILQGLPLIGPVAASLQPYVDGQKQDLFEDFTDEEFLSLMRANESIRTQFLVFADQTVRQWNGRKMCYDFLGRENLMLVKHNGKYKLHIVDVGIFKFDTMPNNSSQKMSQIEERMNRLVSLYERATEI